jgi:long-chain acyl-CoA synthetase
MTDFAGMISAVTVVTLYDTLGKEAIEYIIEQTEMKTIICSADKVKTLIELKKDGKLNSTTTIIYFDDAKKEDIEAAA